MWSSGVNDIPRQDIDREHMRILEEAVPDSQDYDVRTTAVYKALEYFEAQSNRTWGFTVFRQGLEHWNPSALQEGLKLIKQHVGFKN